MELQVIQLDSDKTNYFEKVVSFLQGALGPKPKQEQLESRFDYLLTEFAIYQNAVYDAQTRTLKIGGAL